MSIVAQPLFPLRHCHYCRGREGIRLQRWKKEHLRRRRSGKEVRQEEVCGRGRDWEIVAAGGWGEDMALRGGGAYTDSGRLLLLALLAKQDRVARLTQLREVYYLTVSSSAQHGRVATLF